MRKENITAIILAGGKSSRMKQDKGLVYFNGKGMIEHVLDAVRKVTESIIIISNNPAYDQFGFPCYQDIMKDCGPMGGIYTGLVHSTTKKNIVVSCDTPFVSEKALSTLVQQGKEEDVLVFEQEGKTEPLCGLYDRNCLTLLRQLIERKECKMMDALEKLNTVRIDFRCTGIPMNDIFVNINTPEELEFYQSTGNEN